MMNTHADKSQETKSQSVANDVSHSEIGQTHQPQFTDNRPVAAMQRKIQSIANNSARTKQTAQLQQKMAYSPSMVPISGGNLSKNIVQRNQNITKYTPSAANAMNGIFKDQHAPNDYTVENAIDIHEIRGNIDFNTIIAINGQEMATEINTYLLNMSDNMSQRLEDEEWETTSFDTVDAYPTIETSLDEEGRPVLAVAEISKIQVRMQFMNGYFQVYHFSKKV